MTTSLARQLASLRTPGSVASSLPPAVYSGPFLFPEAETEHSSIASLKECVSESLSVLSEKDPSLARFSILLEMEEGEEEADQLVTDCLTSLCPHLLLRSAQWVLQWLVTKHKVHMSKPSWLVFSVLPYYSYQIYQAVLQSIDSSLKHSDPCSGWLVQFKENCFPTTQLGLHRHAASQLAFLRFLCEALVELSKHLTRFPQAKVHKQTTLVVTTLLGGLENIGEVGDERLLVLLQPILFGFKSSNLDMSSVSSIMLGYLLPKVKFKPKAAMKLCKSVAKLSKKNPSNDSLFLVLLLTRTQQVNMAKILEMVLSHQPVINMIIHQAKHGVEEETGETVDCLLYSLALVMESLQPPAGEVKLSCTHQELQLIELVENIAGLPTDLMVEETADFLIEVLVNLLKSLEENNQTSVFKKKLLVVIGHVERCWPEIYRLAVVSGTEERKGDILFLPGIDRPSANQLEASKILSSNQFMHSLSTSLIVSISNRKGMKKLLKSNVGDLSKILKCETAFLISQVDPVKLEVFLANLVRITDKFPDIQSLAVNHCCSDLLLPIMKLKPILELQLLSLLFTTTSSISSIILSSCFARSSSILSLLSSLSPSSSSFVPSIQEKLVLLLTPEHITTILSTPFLLHNTTLVTIILVLSNQLLTGSPSVWSKSVAELLHQTLLLENIDKELSAQDIESVVIHTKDKSSLPWATVLETVERLSAGENTEVYANLLLSIPNLLQRGLAEEADKIKDCLFTKLGAKCPQFLLKTASSTSDLKVVCFCLMQVAILCNDSNIASNLIQDKNDTSLLHIISFILHFKSRIQKAAYEVLDKLVSSANSGVLMPLLRFFQDHKAEIVNNLDNFSTILAKKKVDTKACKELLVRCTCGQQKLFVKLIPLFKSLSSTKDIEIIFNFGLESLNTENSEISDVIGEIITEFKDAFVKNLSNETVWNFYSSCLSSKMTVTCCGLTKKVSNLLLTTLASSSSFEKISGDLVNKLLSSLVKFIVTDTSLEARNMVVSLSPRPDILLDQLKNIWGQDAFSGGRVMGRGKFSLLYGSKDTSDEDRERWTQTCWLLEIIEKLCVQHKDRVKEQDWLLLVRPLFVLLRKVADMEVEDGTYKLSLLLIVLLQLLNLVPDPKLQEVKAGQLDPELLVHCIRTSPSPDTRQTALKVLARCAVSNPDFILQNSITIFTFMGSHLLKVDSKHSFQVACQALEVIVPAIKTACNTPGRASQLQSTCLGVLTTFVDASMDIPAHRLTEFLVRLINCLGDSEHLWVASLLLVRKDKIGGERKVIELFTKLGVTRGLEALLRILVNTRSDGPHLRKIFGIKLERKEEDEALDKPDEWDVLRLRALQMVGQVLSANSFQKSVGQLLEEDEVGEMLSLLIEAAILTIQEYGTITVPMPTKLKKNLVIHSEKVLEHSLSLLPPHLFLELTSSLLSSTTASVRLRALEVVSSKLAPPTPLPIPSLPPLVSPLVKLALTEDQPHTQQLALLAVRQLAKLLPDTKQLVEAAEAFNCNFLQQLTNPKVLGAAVLSCGDILTCLGPLAVARVPGLVSWLCSRLEGDITVNEKDWSEKEVAVVHNSFLYCLQRLVENFVGFLHPILPRLVTLACNLSGSSSTISGRAKLLLSSLASTIPPHTTLSLSTQLLESVWSNAFSVTPFVNFISDNCRRLERGQLSSVSKQFVELFTKALGYRAKPTTDIESVDEVEDSIITAFLSIALKLSLEDFMPVYQGLVSLHLVGSNSQLTTMFNLTNKVGAKLKSLFSFGVESLILAATDILKEERPSELVSACLTSITTVLTYNKVEMISLVQYEQLVNTLLSSWLLPSPSLPSCLVQLAISTPDDTNWKFLHYQLLLGLRDTRASVRMSVLSVLTQCVTDRMDTYLPVLPDAVPFLQEILEDDDQTVEIACKEFIQHMETTFGQNIESYFQ